MSYKNRASSDTEFRVDLDNIQECKQTEKLMIQKLAELRKTKGLDNPEGFKYAFTLLEVWTADYQLDNVDKLVTEIFPMCKRHGGQWYIKAVQALAFCRWKQSRWKEALELFEQMKILVGPSSVLLENMGHTHNSMGNVDKAADCFLQAIDLCEREGDKNMHKGGLYMGLGLVYDRTNRTAKGLDYLKQALAWYKEKANGEPSSLVAKAHKSVGTCYQHLGKFKEALSHYESAVDLFRKTCGVWSPLSSNALAAVGEMQMQLKRPMKAYVAFAESFENHVRHDNLEITSLYKRSLTLRQLLISAQLKVSNPERFGPMIRDAVRNIERQGIARDGNLAALYKTFAELVILGKYFRFAQWLLHESLALFRTVTEIDISHLIKDTTDILKLIDNLVQQGRGVPMPT